MSYQEKENIINIFSALLISTVYGWIIYQKHLTGQYDLTNDYRQWGMIFLIFIGVSIVARIIIYIIFHIINTIAMRKEESTKLDERDRLVKLKSTRNSHHIFSGGIMLTIISLAIGMPVYGLFIAFVFWGVIAELIDNGSQIYYYRKGV